MLVLPGLQTMYAKRGAFKNERRVLLTNLAWLWQTLALYAKDCLYNAVAERADVFFGRRGAMECRCSLLLIMNTISN